MTPVFAEPLLVSAVLAFFVGGVMGLFGGGGSVLSVPMLLYVTGLEPHAAIAVSLFMVSVASALGALVHARSGRLRLRAALAFAIPSAISAFAGGWLARFVTPELLLVLFSLLMLATAFRMLRTGVEPSPKVTGAAPLFMSLAGAATGFVSGLIGAGGGFLIVPTLVFFAGLSMYEAVGTSLFVMSVSSAAGFLGHASEVSLDAGVLTAVSLPALGGVIVGARLAQRVSSQGLKRGFGLLILVLGLFVLVQQLRSF